jgi:type II secretory pathway component PulJ
VTPRGETLVEVVLALVLLAVGGLALAGGIAGSQRARAAASSSALALSAAEGWLEAWRVAPLAGPASGSETIELGTWEGELEWETEATGWCLETARVSVRAVRGAAGRADLSSARYGVGCVS